MSRCIEQFDGHLVDSPLFTTVFGVLCELKGTALLERERGVVVPVTELEDIVAFEALYGRLLLPVGRFLHDIPPVKVDHLSSRLLPRSVLVLLLHL